MILNIGGVIRKLPVLNAALPADISVDVGTSSTFKIEISELGKPEEYTCQWYYDGKAVSGATGLSYTRNAESGTHEVYCAVTSKAGTIISRKATMTGKRLWVFKTGSGIQNGFGGFSNASYNSTQISKTYLEAGPDLGKDATQYITCNVKADVTHFNKLCLSGVTIEAYSGGANTMTSKVYAGGASKTIKTTNVNTSISGDPAVHVKDGTLNLDISNLSGLVAFGLSLSCNTGGYYHVYAKNVWFEV